MSRVDLDSRPGYPEIHRFASKCAVKSTIEIVFAESWISG